MPLCRSFAFASRLKREGERDEESVSAMVRRARCAGHQVGGGGRVEGTRRGCEGGGKEGMRVVSKETLSRQKRRMGWQGEKGGAERVEGF